MATTKTPPRERPTQRVLDALADHGPNEPGPGGAPWDEHLDAEQRGRALRAPDGLRGKALSQYVLTGEHVGEQVKASRAAAKAARKAPAKAKPASEPKTTSPSGPREGSALHAAVTILTGAQTPMSAQDIYDEAVKRGLAGGLKGKTPVATLSAQMATANKKGVHVERTAPGLYQLRAS